MNAYIYPNSKWKGIDNPYLENFVKSFEGKIDFINFKNTAKTGLFDILNYIFRINIIFFNWVEDVPSKKGGKLQWNIFKYFIYPLLRLRKVKIVWILHNNISHYETHKVVKEQIFKSFFKFSDIILTHAKDGISLIQKELGDNTKSVYFPHPFNSRNRHMGQQKNIDILIWGSVSRYKGIHLFLDQVNENKFLQTLNIKICGKVMDRSYEKELFNKMPENVDFENRFVSEDELDEYLSRSKITLFVYASDSVLSSGALSDSIGYGNVILGPTKGAFKDLNDQNLVFLFNKIEDLPKTCKSILENFEVMKERTNPKSDYVKNHSWTDFSKFFMKFISR